ncbi:DUF397 domain-containing protein [Streptomyces sp. FH025]|uniref:DUF397 domain-containing protein n=1 Tax=Streptomyces sp. FH025 TaxID=2815937 RepID=UPI001A9DDFEF|nr:DUF397 domain-containing protein [Streptomyces sp. FH025]MBO1417819.1 DUF397 domain-containing protein [Streptomyces sp. FH025]
MDVTALYAADLTGADFRSYCGGNQGNDNDESCLTVAAVPGMADSFALGHSENPGVNGAIRVSRAELVTFVRGFAQAEGITL